MYHHNHHIHICYIYNYKYYHIMHLMDDDLNIGLLIILTYEALGVVKFENGFNYGQSR